MRWSVLLESNLVFGDGRAIAAVRHDFSLVQKLRHEAFRQYRSSSYYRRTVSENDFVSAFSSALATRSHYLVRTDSFNRIQQLRSLLGHVDGKRLAASFYNSITASRFAFDDEGNTQTTTRIADALVAAFRRGELLQLPRDDARLYEPAIQQTLPGAMLHYLDKRLPPRCTLCSFEREARIEIAGHSRAVI